MRKFLLAIVAVLGVAGSLPGTSSAEEVTVVDLAITTTDLPDPVAPAPGTVIYKVSATNTSAIAVTANITNSSSGGSLDAGASQLLEQCTASTDSVSCVDVPLGPAETKVFYVGYVVSQDVENTSTIALSPELIDFIDTNADNDTAVETTTVLATNDVQAGTYLAEGDTLTFKKHSLFVRDSDTGVIARMNDADLTGVECGVGTYCEPVGLHLDFLANDVYSGYLLAKVNFGQSPPCRGLGATKCHRLFYRTSPEVPMVEVLDCVTSDYRAEPGPCIELVSKLGTEFVWDVRLTSDDPDLGNLSL